MQPNAAILEAMRSQALGDGDDEIALTVSQLYELAEKYFPRLMDLVFRVFLIACERQGRTAVVGKLSRIDDLMPAQAPIAESYFDAHTADIPEDKRRKLGPDLMSFTLQSIDNPAMRGMFITDSGTTVQNSPSEVTSSTPSKWQTKEFTVGSLQNSYRSDDLSDEFNDKALKITLLMNRLLNTPFWQYIELERAALRPYDLQMCHLGRESEAENVFEVLSIIRSNQIFNFLSLILAVMIRPKPEVGSTTDIFVEVCGWNERKELHSEFTAILELAEPCMAYRAANFLVFGEQPLKEDCSALERYIAVADPLTKQKITEASKQIKHSSNRMSKVDQPSVKRAVVSRDENNKPVYGYTRDGEDITDKLRDCSLKRPVDGFHERLGNVSRKASLNGCAHIAISDGLTFIAMHLQDLREQNSGLVEANFNSHYAIDLTETGSSLRMFQYNINAGYRSDRLRRGVEILLHAAHDEFGGYEITADKSAAFGEQLKLLRGYKFHSRAYTHHDSTADARVFTRHRTPIIKRAIDRFRQMFPALTQCGDYESSAFGILECFKVSGFQLLESETSDPGRGRSRRVTKVNFYGHDEPEKSKHKETCVLKEYDCDAASVERMERELEAYLRIAQLSAGEQRRFAKLVAFGAIDVKGADPRLFILTEYVEDCRRKLPSTEENGMEEKYEFEEEYKAEERAESRKVYDILKSVGVYHNDLEERNFKWQEVNGERFIKVFDFDYATFEDTNSGGLCK